MFGSFPPPASRRSATIFNAPLLTERKIPVAAQGDAGVWLPLLALFGGSRQAEFAGLRVAACNASIGVKPVSTKSASSSWTLKPANT